MKQTMTLSLDPITVDKIDEMIGDGLPLDGVVDYIFLKAIDVAEARGLAKDREMAIQHITTLASLCGFELNSHGRLIDWLVQYTELLEKLDLIETSVEEPMGLGASSNEVS